MISYTGRILTNDFISFLTCPTDKQHFIFSGARFHNLMASLMQVFCVRHDLPISTGLLDLSALVEAPVCSVFCTLIVSGYFSTFNDFQISSSLIWAFNWLTDKIPNLSSSDAVEIMSFTLVPFKVLNSLFWTI